MMKPAQLSICLLLLASSALAQCPSGYEEIHVKCDNKLFRTCVLPERQQDCNLCWEIHFEACQGRPSGGMRSFDSYHQARASAEEDRAVDNSCPWYNDQAYILVQNDPKSCLQKPTGYEMVSPQGQQRVGLQTPTSFGNMNGFFDDTLKYTLIGKETVTQLGSPVTLNQGTNNSGFSSADEAEIWRQVEAILGTLPADVRAALQQYLPAIFEGLLNGDSTALMNLIDQLTNSGTGSNVVGPPSTSFGNMNDFFGNQINATDLNTGAQISSPIPNTTPAANPPPTSTISNPPPASGAGTNNTPPDPWLQQENYVIFWLKDNNDGYQNQAFVRLNGNLLQLRPGAGKALFETSYTPNCSAQERCDNVGFCSGVLRAKLTQRQNTWSAEIINGTNKSGSFTAKPGCNIVELK